MYRRRLPVEDHLLVLQAVQRISCAASYAQAMAAMQQKQQSAPTTPGAGVAGNTVLVTSSGKLKAKDQLATAFPAALVAQLWAIGQADNGPKVESGSNYDSVGLCNQQYSVLQLSPGGCLGQFGPSGHGHKDACSLHMHQAVQHLQCGALNTLGALSLVDPGSLLRVLSGSYGSNPPSALSAADAADKAVCILLALVDQRYPSPVCHRLISQQLQMRPRAAGSIPQTIPAVHADAPAEAAAASALQVQEAAAVLLWRLADESVAVSAALCTTRAVNDVLTALLRLWWVTGSHQPASAMMMA